VAAEVLADALECFILVDCTMPSEMDWDNLKTAIETAHGYVK
jgi:hypothetical protein